MGKVLNNPGRRFTNTSVLLPWSLDRIRIHVKFYPMIKQLLLVLVILFVTTIGRAQVYADLKKDKSDQADYPYILPIWGQKVQDRGFDLPYSAGIGVNYLQQSSDILISNVAIGFNGGELINVDELIRFNSTTADSYGINIRPDVWLLPFLNVYAIFARAESNTNVDVSVRIPGIGEGEELFSLQTSPTFQSQTFGLGLTPTMGFFGGWIAMDMNFTWTDVDKQEKPVFAFIFDPRIGKTFQLGKPERNISVWVGGFRIKVNRDTKGSLPLGDALPIEEWETKIATGQQKVGEAQVELDDWWESLTPIEQANPVNSVRREANQAKLDLAGRVLVTAEDAVDNAGNSTLDYTLDKAQAKMWSLTLGSQFQLNKSWMILAEYGFSSGRQQFLGGLQYRFGL